MFQDVAYAFRTMRKNPGLTAVAVITLALGIGANTAMFSVVNALLLRPLPYRDPGRLVTMRAQIPSRNIKGAFMEYNFYGEWWRGHARSLEAIAAFTPGSATLMTANEPERIALHRVNAGLLGMFGVTPLFGRDFRPEEDQPGASPVALVSHRLWKRKFGGDPGLVGRQIPLGTKSYTVVGILPADFDLFGTENDLLTPIAASTARAPGMPSVGVYARLKRGVSIESAQAEIDGFSKGWKDTYPYPRDYGVRVWQLRDYLVRDARASVVVLAAAVGLVLLIACANVANLLLARAGARRREIAIRNALGAGAGRIVRQMLTESAVLAVASGTLGVLAAWGGVRVLAAASSAYIPMQRNVSIDLLVLVFAIAAALLTVLLFGLAPALSASRVSLTEHLNERGRGGEGLGSRRMRSVLVVVEVALALLLAIGATLTARSLVRLQAVDPGFNPDGLLQATLNLPAESYGEPPKRVAFFKALLERLKSAPGVTSVGMASHLPFSNSKSGSSVVVEGGLPAAEGDRIIVFNRTVDPNYFQTLQARLVRGRYFDDRDPAGSPVAIVNETMAKRCWPNQDPVGKRFGAPQRWTTVVGVIADMRQTSLAEEPDAESFTPYKQAPGATMALVIRTPMDPALLIGAVRGVVRDLDQSLPLADPGPLTESVTRTIRGRRFSVALLASFAALALLLAAVGIYGVISYSVTRRTHEIGIRMALGAERSRIAGMVVGRALLLGGAGVAIGAGGALALTRLLRSMLFGVSATDPTVFVAVSLFLMAVTALAGYIPARRASRVDPGIALRYE